MNRRAEPRATDKGRLHGLLSEMAVKHGEFILSSGQTSDFYVDCRRVTYHALGADIIGRLFCAKLITFEKDSGVFIDAVGGLTMGADPIAMAMVMTGGGHRQINGFSIRKEAKDHGASGGSRFVGPLNLERNWNALVIEDVVTTGASAISAIEALRAETDQKITVRGVFCLVDREEGGMQAITDQTGLPAWALFRRKDFQK